MLLRLLAAFLPFLLLATTWSEAETLSSPGTNSSDPKIVSAPNKSLVAAWIEEGLVKAKTRPAGGAWGASETLSGSGASSLQLAVDGVGNAFAIWVESESVKTRILPLGGAWGSATALSGANSSSPQIAANSAGDAAAVWVEGGAVQSKTRLAMGDWQPMADTLAVSGATPHIAVGGTTVAAVWSQVDAAMSKIYANQKSVSGSWGEAGAISESRYKCAYPKIAVDRYGNLLAAWYRYIFQGGVYSSVVMQSAFQASGCSWGEPDDVSGTGIRNPADLTIDLDFNYGGLGLATWTNSSDGSLFTVDGSVRGSNGWIGVTAFQPADIFAYSMSLSVEPYGLAALVYMDHDEEDGKCILQSRFANTYSAFQNVSPPEPLPVQNDAGYPSAALAFGSGSWQIGAVWLEYDGMFAAVRSSIGNRPNSIPPVQSASVAQSAENCGLFIEYANTVSWTNTSGYTAQGVNLFRNGQPIISLPVSVTSYIDHNQKQNGPVTYGIAYFSIDGNQGPITTVSLP